MKIIDLEESNHKLYHECLENWPDAMKESGYRESLWHERER